MIDAFKSSWLLLPALLITLPVHATTYYVATNGNDSWTGTSPTHVSGMTGPFADFAKFNYGGSQQLQPGDVLYVGGGTYWHTNDSQGYLFLANVYGTQSQPIIVSNYPGQYPVIHGSGTNSGALTVSGGAWIKILGINVTNDFRGATFQSVTNCEIAYCDFGGGDTNEGYGTTCTFEASSQSNWIHNCRIHDCIVSPVYGDAGHCLMLGQPFGTYNGQPDNTSYNIVESNVLYHSCHDVLSVYGYNNVVRKNFIHNEAFIFRTDILTNGAARCVESGGANGYNNVIEYNRFQYAGITPTGGSHGLELDGAGSTIIRGNVFSDNTYSGLTIYGGKFASSLFWGSNYVYNNTIALNGFGPTKKVILYNTNGVAYQTNNLSVWTPALTIAHSTNNFLVNNLFWSNCTNSYNVAALTITDPAKIAVASFANNLTNINPLFADTTDGGPWSQTQPNFALTSGSPAIGGGTWLATITSSSGSGTSFNVNNAGWFFAGLTAAGHTVPGDTIQLQGQASTVVITSISGNTITVNRSLTWTNRQGVALSYSGSAPDVGAYEYTSRPAPPIGLRIITAVPQG